MSTMAATLTRLLLSERASLSRRLRRILLDNAVEDVLQELWFKIQTVADDPPIDNPRAYLYRVAMNAAVDARRSAIRRGSEVEAEVAALLWVEDDRPSPDRVAVDRDMLDRIGRAIETLPEPTRTIFRLNRFSGLPQREIAGRYGVSTTIIERHIRRALKALDAVREPPDNFS